MLLTKMAFLLSHLVLFKGSTANVNRRDRVYYCRIYSPQSSGGCPGNSSVVVPDEDDRVRRSLTEGRTATALQNTPAGRQWTDKINPEQKEAIGGSLYLRFDLRRSPPPDVM